MNGLDYHLRGIIQGVHEGRGLPSPLCHNTGLDSVLSTLPSEQIVPSTGQQLYVMNKWHC